MGSQEAAHGDTDGRAEGASGGLSKNRGAAGESRHCKS